MSHEDAEEQLEKDKAVEECEFRYIQSKLRWDVISIMNHRMVKEDIESAIEANQPKAPIFNGYFSNTALKMAI